MNRFFIKKENVSDNIATVSEKTDVNHILKVLRMNLGDDAEICVSSGEVYLGELQNITSESVEFRIIEKIEKVYESPINIDIYQGLPKSTKMDLIIQKNTELGVKTFTAVNFDRCITFFKDKKSENKKIERWQKIAEAAAKQSKRTYIPKINESIDMDRLVILSKNYDLLIIAYENDEDTGIKKVFSDIKSKNIDSKKVAIVIGPEGGFEESEIDILKELSNSYIINLGTRILRTETAGFVISSIIQYEIGDLG
ncbi:RsmE family RNA methyltransferase [Helicovermis profundi]|uniref:Ribosomal RNA small subunit methyltransferase E n=1 Tax=Helicovermis profundi TaxID=3065157 RepID=A0AAU9E8A7_9FIRM|nr:16S rRNA (uracil(1498)-N(3))-methyltransferase [Clostridia bacterium S502]